MPRFNSVLAAITISTVALCAQIACSRLTAPAPQPASTTTVLQVMRGILFPSSNVIFAAQSDDPAKIAAAADPATATDH